MPLSLMEFEILALACCEAGGMRSMCVSTRDTSRHSTVSSSAFSVRSSVTVERRCMSMFV